VVGLVVLSLALLTISFRSTALDPVESASASALRPFEIAANRVAHPFRDAANWTHGLFKAKSENRKLRAENARLRRINAALVGAQNENAQLHKLLHYAQGPSFPKDFGEVGASVLTSPSSLDQSITISAGSNEGIKLNDVVITNEGLVGTISKVFGGEARVTLLTDPTSAVRAVDQKNLAAVGLLDHGTGASALVLDRVGKDKPPVYAGDTIITAGSPSGSKLASLYPRNIPIGFVSSVGQNDTDIFKDIQVQPFVDFSSLESVLVLIPKPADHAKPGKHK
jgi:rod shape-determining protein MreC